MRRSTVGWLVAGALLAGVMVPAEGARTRSLEPVAPWTIDPLDRACRLSRSFGEGEERVDLFYLRYMPGTVLRLEVTGPGVGIPRQSTWILLQYGPNRRERRENVYQGELVSGGTGWQVHNASILPVGAESSSAEFELRIARQIDSLSLGLGSFEKTLLKTGPMDEPLRLIHECIRTQMARRGVDIGDPSQVSRPASPLGDPATWLAYTDIPISDVPRGATVTISMMLTVDENGSITGCYTNDWSNGPNAQKICGLIRERARFAPALDTDGKPVRSYWARDLVFRWPT